jgi:hypothetical protein
MKSIGVRGFSKGPFEFTDRTHHPPRLRPSTHDELNCKDSGRKIHKATQSTTEDEFLTWRKYGLSEWHEQGALRSESQARKYVLNQTEKDMDEEHKKYIHKEKKRYIQPLQPESFHQSFRTFTLGFNRAQITYNRHCLHYLANQPGLH